MYVKKWSKAKNDPEMVQSVAHYNMNVILLTIVTASCSAARFVFLLKLLLNAVVASFCMLLSGVVIQYKNIISDKMRTSKTSILFFETGIRPCTSLSICFSGSKKRKSLSEAINSNGSSFETQVSFFSDPFE